MRREASLKKMLTNFGDEAVYWSDSTGTIVHGTGENGTVYDNIAACLPVAGEGFQPLTGDVIGKEGFAQFQRRVHRKTVNGNVLRPTDSLAVFPESSKSGQAATLLPDVGQDLCRTFNPDIMLGRRRTGLEVIFFHRTRKTVPQTEYAEQTKIRLAKCLARGSYSTGKS